MKYIFLKFGFSGISYTIYSYQVYQTSFWRFHLMGNAAYFYNMLKTCDIFKLNCYDLKLHFYLGEYIFIVKKKGIKKPHF